MKESPESRLPSNKVTLEELLRLKQAERPSAEFWTQFERDFRTRQLAAAVEKRRWWFALPQVFSGASRLQIPLGATAILAVTFLTIREYRQPEIAPGFAPSQPALVSTLPVSAADSTIVRSDLPTPSPVRVAAEAAPMTAAVPGRETSVESSGWDVNALMDTNSRAYGLSPSGRSIAANLPSAAELDPEMARLIEAQAASLQLASTREPLSEVTSPRDARRNRLFAYLGDPSGSSVSLEEATLVRERLASRLSEEQLYDQVRRIGGGADRLTVKF